MYLQLETEYDVTNISGTQPRKNMKTMGKVDTSDLMMIITWTIDISFQWPYLNGPVGLAGGNNTSQSDAEMLCISNGNHLINAKPNTYIKQKQ